MCADACRCRRRRAHRARRPPPAPPPCRPASGTPRPVPASTVIGTRRAITAPMPPPMRDAERRPAPRRRCRPADATASVVTIGDRHADHAEQVALPAGLRARQPAQRQDEQDAGDEIEQRGEIGGHRRVPHFFFFWYMPSMRWVTRKPPKMLTEARTSATKPSARAQIGPASLADQRHADREQRADHDHRGDRVGHRHQRRVQRRRHRPDHVVADEDRQHEDREPEHERIDRVRRCRVTACAGRRQRSASLERASRLRSRMAATRAARRRSRALGGLRSCVMVRAHSRRALGREGRMDDGAVARERGRLDDLVVPVDRERLLLSCRSAISRNVRGSWRRAPTPRRRAGPAR